MGPIVYQKERGERQRHIGILSNAANRIEMHVRACPRRTIFSCMLTFCWKRTFLRNNKPTLKLAPVASITLTPTIHPFITATCSLINIHRTNHEHLDETQAEVMCWPECSITFNIHRLMLKETQGNIEGFERIVQQQGLFV